MFLFVVLYSIHFVSCEDWRVLSSLKFDNTAAERGEVFAVGHDGLYEQRDTVGSLNAFFKDKTVSCVWASPSASKQAGTVFAVADGVLYSSTTKDKWSPALPDKDDREIIAIHGNGKTTAFLARIKPDLDHEDTTHAKTVRSAVFVSNSTDLANAAEVGRFPASKIFVSTEGYLITYGDIHGPYPPNVGFSKDHGGRWRHSQPWTGMKGGSIAFSDDVLYIAATSGDFVKSYDQGRTYTHITYLNGVPQSTSYNAVLAMGEVVIVATQGEGLLVSQDEATSFPYRATYGNRGFPSQNVLSVAFDPSIKALYAATDAGLAVKTNMDQPEESHMETASWLSKLFWGTEAKLQF